MSIKPESAGFVPDERVVEAIRAGLVEGKLPCAQAFAIANRMGIPPLEVGRTADVLEVHLNRCQLGLFGYPHKQGWVGTTLPARPLPDGLEAAIRAASGNEGRLTCAQAWEIAARFHVPKMQVGYVADRMGVRVVQCQLGAF